MTQIKLASVKRVAFKHIPTGMMFYHYCHDGSGTIYLRALPYDRDRLPYVRHGDRCQDDIVFCVPHELVPERYHSVYGEQWLSGFHEFYGDDPDDCDYLLTYIKAVPVTVDILCGE